MRINGKRLIENHARHFPVASSCVFPGRRQTAFSISACWLFHSRQARQRLNTRQAHARQIRQFYFSPVANVSQRVAAFVAIIAGVGHGANAHTIENNPDDAVKVMQGNSFPLRSLEFIFQASGALSGQVHD
jgi:hypothetical protein